MAVKTEEWKREIKEHFGRSPIVHTIGYTLEEVGDGWATVRLKAQEKHIHAGGIVHGGVLLTIADAALTAALFSLYGPNGSMIAEMKINFMRPTVPGGELEAKATVTHKGRRLCVGEVDIRNSEGKLVAKCLGTAVNQAE